MKVSIDVQFSLGETVYLKIRQERRPGMVTGYYVRPGGVVTYWVTWSQSERMHFDIELTKDYVPNYIDTD